MTPKKPNFLIIGSAKCGTTTLAGILDSHPDCCFSHPKEVWFFQEKALNSPDASKLNPNYSKGWEWYSQAWSHYNGESMVGEATPAYSDRTHCPQVASRIHAFNPEMKIIYMVREPLARQISLWQMMIRRSYEFPDEAKELARAARAGFETFFTYPGFSTPLWDETRYHYQLEPYLKLFPRKNVLVSFLLDWKLDQVKEVTRILRFLDLDPQKVSLKENFALHEAKNAKIHTPLQRLLVKTGLRPTLKRLTGEELWSNFSKKYAMAPIHPPEAKITSKTLRNFLDYVRDDSQAFLKDWGKPADWWKPTKVMLLDL